MIPVLIVTGPIGAGKTAVLHEADSLLVAVESRHATVELEELARCWSPAIGPDRRSFVNRTLAAVWANFESVGADRLLLSGLVEQRSDVEGVVDSVQDAAVTIARLRAPLALLEQRIRSRETGLGVEGELDGARWWARHFEREHPEDFVVETENRPVREIAREMLRRAGWLV
jgi:chloramphenicol 3-O-phosphotransferase